MKKWRNPQGLLRKMWATSTCHSAKRVRSVTVTVKFVHLHDRGRSLDARLGLGPRQSKSAERAESAAVLGKMVTASSCIVEEPHGMAPSSLYTAGSASAYRNFSRP